MKSLLISLSIIFAFSTVSACASKDPAAELKARKERAEEQRNNAARADAELRRATKK